mmetsp:Transcript_29394/g.99920  ORF Transcript_29394/g.99920 Transcript_29394/m.99920 type:complete len:99 (-) Transcript_29394:44-340(-)
MVECSKIREFHSNSEFSTPILMHQGLTILVCSPCAKVPQKVKISFLYITPNSLRISTPTNPQNTSYGLEEIHGLRQRQQFCQKVTSRDSYKYYAVANY